MLSVQVWLDVVRRVKLCPCGHSMIEMHHWRCAARPRAKPEWVQCQCDSKGLFTNPKAKPDWSSWSGQRQVRYDVEVLRSARLAVRRRGAALSSTNLSVWVRHRPPTPSLQLTKCGHPRRTVHVHEGRVSFDRPRPAPDPGHAHVVQQVAAHLVLRVLASS